nr:MAG TPA: hypothetical protein [Caudoviricetes sp.]
MLRLTPNSFAISFTSFPDSYIFIIFSIVISGYTFLCILLLLSFIPLSIRYFFVVGLLTPIASATS